jgi:hypothetical protein
MSGIIEKIALLGREFTIQTEHLPGPDARIRTFAYDGGRLVSVREASVDPADVARGLVETKVREHHARITDNLYKRAAELAASKSLGSVAPARGGSPEPPTEPVAKGRPRPAVDPGSRLAQSIATRQTIGPFSLAFACPAPAAADELTPLLEAAEGVIDDIMSAPIFQQLRLDEQLTFIALRGQLATWRLSDRDPSVAEEVWSNIERFAGHLQLISNRSELVAFDHELLTWAMSELGQGAVSDELVAGLEALAGRDGDLDHLLSHPDLMSPESLLEVLLALLDRTLA